MVVTVAGDTLAIAPRRRHDLAQFVRAVAAFAAAVAAMVLLGWASENDVLKSVVPGHSPMRANAAVGLLLCALALHAGGSAVPGWRTL